MANDDKAIEQLVLTRLLRLNAMIMGFIAGAIGGIGLFLATLFLVIKGGTNVGAHLGLLNHFFPGYSVTWGGSILGLIYGFITAFIVGFFIAAVYNWLAEWRESRQMSRS
jgi:hypothetical protein